MRENNDGEREAGAAAARGDTAADAAKARALLVDDMETNLYAASKLMRGYGLETDCVTNALAAIGRIRDGDPPYDAVFMDHMMPEMDGVEAARAIRALDSIYAKEIPIIALTADIV